MWEETLILGVVFLILNIVFWFVAVRILAGVYNRRFNEMINVIHDGMEARDAAFAGLKAMVTRAIVHDTAFFDDAVSMTDEEEIVDGRKEEDQE